MPAPASGPALGLLELESLARGIVVADALVKQAAVQIVIAEAVLTALLRAEVSKVGPSDAVGIVELHTVAATLKAADAALKRANVKLTQFHVARGIGGKGWFTVAGVQHDVEAALEGAATAVQPSLLVATELIQRPHAELRGRVI